MAFTAFFAFTTPLTVTALEHEYILFIEHILHSFFLIFSLYTNEQPLSQLPVINLSFLAGSFSDVLMRQDHSEGHCAEFCPF